MRNSVLGKITHNMPVRLLAACAGLLSSGALYGATYTSFLETATDVAKAGSWQGGKLPGTTSTDIALFQNLNKTLTAGADSTFGLMQYNCVGSMPSVNLVFDMTDAAAGIADGDGPRKINVLGMRLESNNTSVELKGGLWNFATPTQYPAWNVIYSTASNAVLTLSSGAVITNIAAAGYNHFSAARNSAIRLVGGSKWYGKSSLWPFKGGTGNVFHVGDGSYVSAAGLDLGRLDGTTTQLCDNRLEVVGAGTKMRITTATANVGGSSAYGGASNGNELLVTNQAQVTVTSATIVGPGSFRNLVRLVDRATYDAQAFVVGGQVGSTGNVVRVEGAASLTTAKLTVGRGADGNSLLVDNGSVTGSELVLGEVNSSSRGCSNLVRVTGANSVFKMTGGMVFGRGDFNTLEVDGANLNLGCSVEFSYSDAASQYKNRGNKVVLKNGAVLTAENFRLGSATDCGENALEISESARLSATWLMAYSNDVVRIKIPSNGLAQPAVSVLSYLTFKDTTCLDIDASDWTGGPRTCVLMRSQYGTSEQINFNRAMLEATNARLGGRYAVSVTTDGKGLQIRRLTGLGIVIR